MQVVSSPRSMGANWMGGAGEINVFFWSVQRLHAIKYSMFRYLSLLHPLALATGHLDMLFLYMLGVVFGMKFFVLFI